MAFNHVKLPELEFELQSQTTEAGREYVTPTGKSYPSVTTVLSEYNKKAFFEWRERVGAEEANKIAAKINKSFGVKVVEFQQFGDFVDAVISIPKSLIDKYFNNELRLEEDLLLDEDDSQGGGQHFFCSCLGTTISPHSRHTLHNLGVHPTPQLGREVDKIFFPFLVCAHVYPANLTYTEHTDHGNLTNFD